MSDNLSEIFDVNPLPSTEVVQVSNKLDQRIGSDADYARNNIKDLIDTARTALQHALDVAVQSESPRAYEVLANLINTSADLNTKLVDVHQREQRMSGGDTKAAPQTQNVTNNVVFSGTSAELNDMISKRLLKV